MADEDEEVMLDTDTELAEEEPEQEVEQDTDTELATETEETNAEEETYRQRYDNLVTKLGAQGDELGELRKFRDQVAPIIEQIQRGQLKPVEPEVDERTAAAKPIADRRYDKLMATGDYTREDASREAYEYAFDIVDAAGSIAEQKVAKLTPSIERAGRGVIAEEVTTILNESGIDGVVWDDIRDEFKGIGVKEWQAADPGAVKMTVMRIAKAARSDKIDAGTYTPKSKARPKPGDNVAVDGAKGGNGAATSARHAALAEQMNREFGVEGLTAEQVRAAEARWQAKGGK